MATNDDNHLREGPGQKPPEVTGSIRFEPITNGSGAPEDANADTYLVYDDSDDASKHAWIEIDAGYVYEIDPMLQ